MKIGIVGFGHLGYALYLALTKLGFEVLVNNGSYLRTIMKLDPKEISRSKAVTISRMAKECQVIVLCIRSKDLELVGYKLSKVLTNNHLVLSFLAQTPLEVVEAKVGSLAVVTKVMTTLGVAEHKGVSAYQFSDSVTLEKKNTVVSLLQQISALECVFQLGSESEMQLFTVAVGCFPGVMAYLLVLLKASVNKRNGHSLGDYQKVLPTLLESVAELLRQSGSPMALQKQVATKGGVTEAIIEALSGFELELVFDEGISAGISVMEG